MSKMFSYEILSLLFPECPHAYNKGDHVIWRNVTDLQLDGLQQEG